MRSRVEKFIDDHRGEFDSDEPSPLLWETINKKLEQTPRSRVVSFRVARLVSAAAILVLMIGAGYFYLRSNNSNTRELTAIRNTDVQTDQIIKEISPEYAREVSHFTQLIELKQNELQQIKKAQPELYNTFLADITKLDSSYNSLQRQLPQNPNREQLLEAMIQNLRLQTELLNQQLLIIQKIKNYKSNHDENSKGI